MTSTDSLRAPLAEEPLAVPTTGDPANSDAATRAFSTSILISAVRCLLTYIVFPWLLPAFGFVGGVGPGIGLVIGLVAIGFNLASIRRFWRADHPWKLPVSALNVGVIALLAVLVVMDVQDLLT